MIIKRAAVEEAGEILELQKLAYLSEARIYNDHSIPPLLQTAEQIEAEFQSHLFLEALEDDRIVGSVRACLDSGTCRIGKLIVHPDLQNRGIGTKLLKEIERRFDEAERFELFTGHKSERNLHLYRKFGYRIFRREKLNDRLTLVYMEKHNIGEASLRENRLLRFELDRLREASEEQLRSYDRERGETLLRWFRSRRPDRMFPGDDYLLTAYRVLMDRLQTSEADCPITYRDERKLIFHSTNFCPTLEACKILNLDTRQVCKVYNEMSTDLLVKEIHPQLRFTRNYEKLRPHFAYCEEIIEFEK
jgi:ribosomal protein S18 acetylase RimI-like enzyme